MEDEETPNKKKKKPSINKASCLICQNELKEENVSTISNFPCCSCQYE